MGRYRYSGGEPDGRYGRWNWTGIFTYALGVLVQLPFVANGFYQGALVSWFDGNDISWLIGWVFTALCWLGVNKLRNQPHLSATVLPD